MILRPLLMIIAGLLLASGCDVEYKNSKMDGGWKTVAVGLCETKDGRETERTCSEAKMCKYYCCECENKTQYTVAACSAEEGCLSFGNSCAAAEKEACGE